MRFIFSDPGNRFLWNQPVKLISFKKKKETKEKKKKKGKKKK